jgi:hypothetical protein
MDDPHADDGDRRDIVREDGEPLLLDGGVLREICVPAER